jgi:extracellular elastinolytic metalloproteinase
MPREKDTRDYSVTRQASTGAEDTAVRARATVNAAPRRNAVTGAPAWLTVDKPTDGGDYVAAAIKHVRDSTVSKGLGFSDEESPEFVPDPHVQQTSAGTRVVHLQQQYKGIPIFEMSRSVQFDSAGRIERFVGDNISVTEPVAAQPALSAPEALAIAARYLADNEDSTESDGWGQTSPPQALTLPAGYAPRIISTFDKPSRPTVLESGPFAKEVNASLTFFYTGTQLRLSWKLMVALPAFTEQYVLLVAADRPASDFQSSDDAILLCQRTTSGVTARVFFRNPGTSEREVVALPILADRYPLSGTRTRLPDPFPAAWWVDADRTIGNCAAFVQAADSAPLLGTATGADGDVRFDPAEAEGAEQQLLNAFFFCNYMHDFFYQLGFDEQAGNFQKSNLTGNGLANDAVQGRVHAKPIPKTATFETPAEGLPPTLNLGTVVHANGVIRHTALDADVVFHEYVHGVTNRLVGGRLNGLSLQQPQSRGMGEGWGDYFAMTIQSHDMAVEKVVIGEWVSGKPGGIRSAPYDDQYPNSFGQIGVAPFTREHAIGEIWCATLMQMNRNLDAVLGAPVGHRLAWQIVVDALKLTPSNPGFLDARDAILKAFEQSSRDGVLIAENVERGRRAIWSAFARFGMGPGAQSNGASLQGIVEDTTLPLDLQPSAISISL